VLVRKAVRSWRESFISQDEPLLSVSGWFKGAFRSHVFSLNTSEVANFLSCLAGKTQGKNVGTPYEEIRPITLFGVPPTERAQETGLAESSLRRAAAAFDTHGMISLFRPRHPLNERIIIGRCQSPRASSSWILRPSIRILR